MRIYNQVSFDYSVLGDRRPKTGRRTLFGPKRRGESEDVRVERFSNTYQY